MKNKNEEVVKFNETLDTMAEMIKEAVDLELEEAHNTGLSAEARRAHYDNVKSLTETLSELAKIRIEGENPKKKKKADAESVIIKILDVCEKGLVAAIPAGITVWAVKKAYNYESTDQILTSPTSRLLVNRAIR